MKTLREVLAEPRLQLRAGAVPCRPWFKPSGPDIAEAINTAAGIDTCKEEVKS